MCGIFAQLSKEPISQEVNCADNIKLRGPDNKNYVKVSQNVAFCFHRLKINDLSDDGNQPIFYQDTAIICNGEIYNSDELREEFDVEWKSNSDCEVLNHVYKKYGFEKMMNKIDGVFAIVLFDQTENRVYLGRDPFGVRPMFFGSDDTQIQIASEMKAIDPNLKVSQFPSGHYMKIHPNTLRTMYCKNCVPVKYFHINQNEEQISYEEACKQVKESFEKAVTKRLMSDRPIGCLLSGGLDSSLVCSIVAREFKKSGKGQLNTFSIGFEGSTDLENAKVVAEHIGSVHHEILLTEQDFLDAIIPVIKSIESYDTTTVRASVGNYLVSKYIKEYTDITVIFNGDGSDEVAGGYKYMKNAPNKEEFNSECLRLLDEIAFFDVLRSDRSMSSEWSLESRTPFLDKTFVQKYLNMPIDFRLPISYDIEKSLLRNAFNDDKLLPNSILWRKKEAFSDGVSGTKNSWHKVIQKYIDTQISDDEFCNVNNKIMHNPPQLKESYYYRKIFEEFYPNKSEIIPHFWMPKWTDTVDPSARELE